MLGTIAELRPWSRLCHSNRPPKSSSVARSPRVPTGVPIASRRRALLDSRARASWRPWLRAAAWSDRDHVAPSSSPNGGFPPPRPGETRPVPADPAAAMPVHMYDTPDLSGKTVARRYRLRRRLGGGGFGTVYEAL